jgi:hypothetical protein
MNTLTQIIFGKEWKSWSTSLCTLPQPPVTSSNLVWTSFYKKSKTGSVQYVEPRATFVAVQNNKYYFSENVLAALGIQHVKRMRHNVMWPARLYNIFHAISKPHDFRKSVFKHQISVLVFSTTFIWNLSHSKKKWTTYCHKCAQVFVQNTRLTRQSWITLELSRQVF